MARLEEAIAPALRSGDLDGVLAMLIEGCAPLWHRTRSIGHIGGSETLDAVCRAIGREVLARLNTVPGTCSVGHAPGPRNVYLVTEVYRAGGHGRILEDIIAAYPDRDHSVIWTYGEHVSADEFPHRIRVDRMPAVHTLAGSPLEKLRRAFKLVAEIGPDAVFHLGHPNDAITVAMMQPSLARRLVMIHIADASFALGRYLPDTVHVALGGMFQEFARSTWGIEMPVLPLTCAAPASGTTFAPKSGEEFVTATAGAGHKFSPRGSASYTDLLAARFAARSGRHVHFGDLQPAQLESIRNSLERLGHWGRFIHIEHVPRVASALQQHSVDLYLDSYPVGGARANIEAMAAGLPICTGLHEPNLDGWSFCYPQSLTWATPRELERLLASLDSETLTAHAQMSRAYYAQHHSAAVFERRLAELTGLYDAARS